MSPRVVTASSPKDELKSAANVTVAALLSWNVSLWSSKVDMACFALYITPINPRNAIGRTKQFRREDRANMKEQQGTRRWKDEVRGHTIHAIPTTPLHCAISGLHMQRARDVRVTEASVKQYMYDGKHVEVTSAILDMQ